jgi:prolyl-tRNA synthetase
MRQSQLFTKTEKEISKDEASVNAQLLERGSFVYKNSAGVYTYLPLGFKVLQKIIKIIRGEMNAIGGQELFMPALHDKKYLSTTGRWEVDVVYKVAGEKGEDPSYNISWTHEEISTEIASHFVSSYKDLPFSFYQFQTKFRNEPRAKSGLLRGKEFMMKDLYSFHVDDADLDRFYEEVARAYHKIFQRCGIKAIYTLAGGGDFTTNFTHEFQTISSAGEDTIYVCNKCQYAENKEIAKLSAGDQCPKCDGKIEEHKSIEVGNIFRYGDKYSKAFNLQFTDEKGEKKFVKTGAYGIGLGRVMATIVEVCHDERGIIWPKEVAPFAAHLIALPGGEKVADEIYDDLQKNGIEALYDDRQEKSAGEKFADCDLIGIPKRIVVSEKTLAKDSVELKERGQSEIKLIKPNEIEKYLK